MDFFFYSLKSEFSFSLLPLTVVTCLCISSCQRGCVLVCVCVSQVSPLLICLPNVASNQRKVPKQTGDFFISSIHPFSGAGYVWFSNFCHLSVSPCKAEARRENFTQKERESRENVWVPMQMYVSFSLLKFLYSADGSCMSVYVCVSVVCVAQWKPCDILMDTLFSFLPSLDNRCLCITATTLLC